MCIRWEQNKFVVDKTILLWLFYLSLSFFQFEIKI